MSRVVHTFAYIILIMLVIGQANSYEKCTIENETLESERKYTATREEREIIDCEVIRAVMYDTQMYYIKQIGRCLTQKEYEKYIEVFGEEVTDSGTE